MIFKNKLFQHILCEGQVLKNFIEIFGNSEIENLWKFRKPEVFKRRYFWSIWTLDSNPIHLCEGQVLKNFIEIFGNIQKALLLKYLNLGFKSYPFMRGTGPKKFQKNFWEFRDW